MQVDTWHTGHPLDEARFHVALKRAFNDLGIAISGADFQESIAQLALELHPAWQDAHHSKLVDEFASKAECISSYLVDSQNA
jgi:hypothetical protein